MSEPVDTCENTSVVVTDEKPIITNEMGIAFWQWLAKSLESGQLSVNKNDSIVHKLGGKLFLVFPDIFTQYSLEVLGTDARNTWRKVQRSFHTLEKHYPTKERSHIYQAQLSYSDQVKYIKGYVIKRESNDLGETYNDNPRMVFATPADDKKKIESVPVSTEPQFTDWLVDPKYFHQIEEKEEYRVETFENKEDELKSKKAFEAIAPVSGEAFIEWVRESILSGELLVSDDNALIYKVNGFPFLVGPDIFYEYCKVTYGRITEGQWKRVQAAFKRLRLHHKPAGMNHLVDIEIRHPGLGNIPISGYLLRSNALFKGPKIKNCPHVRVLTALKNKAV